MEGLIKGGEKGRETQIITAFDEYFEMKLGPLQSTEKDKQTTVNNQLI